MISANSIPTTRQRSAAWDEYGYDAAALEDLVKARYTGAFAHFGDLCRPGFMDQVFARRT